MRVIIRAFNQDKYHKDIVLMSDKQVHCSDSRVGEPVDSIFSGLIGVGVSIDPKKFPEINHFEVVIEKE